MGKRYTVTVYVAAPGTPLTKEDGSPKILENGRQDFSAVGHLYYKVSDGTETGTVGFGFAPEEEGQAIGKGKVKPDEFKKYQNPVYERTLEVSEEQYRALIAFGKEPAIGGFDKNRYNGATNSCVDFLYAALAYAKIYNPVRTIYAEEDIVYERKYEGTVRVRPNMDELDKIPLQPGYEHSELNTPKDQRRKNPDPGCREAFGGLPDKGRRTDPQAWKEAWRELNIGKRMLCELAENSQTPEEQNRQYAKVPDLTQPLRADASDAELIEYGFAALLAENEALHDQGLKNLLASTQAEQFEQAGIQAVLQLEQQQQQAQRPSNPVMTM